MPLILSDSPEVRSRRAATIELHAAAVEAPSCTRTDVDGPIPERAGKTTPARPSIDIVEEWGLQSFPASDPPTNW